MIRGRSPFRAWYTIEGGVALELAAQAPQRGCLPKATRRERSRPRSSNAAAAATINNETTCCQSTRSR
jgi:hypothetical protein